MPVDLWVFMFGIILGDVLDWVCGNDLLCLWFYGVVCVLFKYCGFSVLILVFVSPTWMLVLNVCFRFVLLFTVMVIDSASLT